MWRRANLVKDFFIVTSLISMVLYLGMFGILPKKIFFSYYFKYIWAIFYLVNGPFLLYYLLVKNNAFEQKVNYYRDELAKFFRKNFGNRASKLFKALYSLAEAITVVLFIQRFFLGHFMVPTPSMVPIIMPGDHYLVDMISNKFFEPEREKIYIFASTVNVHSKNDRWCKRLMGLPGERIKIEDERLYVNDLPINRRYVQGNMTKEWIVPKRGDILRLEDALFEYMGKIISLEEARAMNLRTIDDVEVVHRGTFFLNGEETGPIFDSEVYLNLINSEEIELEEDFLFFLGDNTDGSHDSRYMGFVNRSRVEGRAIFRIWPMNRIGLTE